MEPTKGDIRNFGDFDLNLGRDGIEAGHAMYYRTLAAWAYIYSIPAFLTLRQRSEFIMGWEYAAKQGGALDSGVSAGAVGKAGVSPLGAWMMLPNRATPKTATVLPAVDHLYGAAILQLDQLGPVVLSIPENKADRYYSVVFVDAFLNNFAYVGPQWTGNMTNHFLIAPPGWEGTVPEWINRCWKSPSNTVTAFNRVMVKADDSDMGEVKEWRKGIRFTPLSRWGEANPTMHSTDHAQFVHPDLRALKDPFRYFRLVFDFIKENPSGSEDVGLLGLFQAAGIGPGMETPSDPKVRAAMLAGVKDGQDMLDGGASGGTFVKGWKIPSMNVGKAGPFIFERAVVQQKQIGSNIPQESIYHIAYQDQNGQVLDGSKGRYDLRFEKGRLPPVKRPGFWSLTMYKRSDSLLVDNPLNRYYVRTDTPGFTIAPDGSATVVMSTERPGNVPEGNWLPAPQQEFIVALRMYYPHEDALEYRWMPPAIVREDRTG